MTAYWLALGFSGIVFALAVSFAFLPIDPGKFDERQIRVYRLTLEGRRAPVGHVFIISLGLLWLIIAVEEILSGSPIGFAYLIPAILFLTSIWLYRSNRIKTLRMLGDRGLVPRAASEERAGVWYRRWGTVSVVGWVGPSVMEFNYQQSFETVDPFKDGASTAHFLLSMCLIIGVTGLLITYFRTRRGEKDERSTVREQPIEKEIHRLPLVGTSDFISITTDSDGYIDSFHRESGTGFATWSATPPSDHNFWVAAHMVDGELWINTFDGWRVQLNLDTGEVVETHFTK